MSENNGVTGERQVVLFDLNKEAYGVDISQVREIIRMQEITRVPRVPEFVEGIIKPPRQGEPGGRPQGALLNAQYRAHR